jgi:hypothetical protein
MKQHADDDILLEEVQVIMTYWKKCGGISNLHAECRCQFTHTDSVSSTAQACNATRAKSNKILTSLYDVEVR